MARSCHYIEAKTFEDFKENQNKLIEVLNHNMTKLTSSNAELSNDVKWLKKLSGWQLGVISALTIGIVAKFIIG